MSGVAFCEVSFFIYNHTLYTADITYSSPYCHLQTFSDDAAIVGLRMMMTVQRSDTGQIQDSDPLAVRHSDHCSTD